MYPHPWYPQVYPTQNGPFVDPLQYMLGGLQEAPPPATSQEHRQTKSRASLQIGLKKEVYSPLAFRVTVRDAKTIDSTKDGENWTSLSVDFGQDLLREIRVYGTDCAWTLRANLGTRVCSWSKDRKNNRGQVSFPLYSYVRVGSCNEEGESDSLSSSWILANGHHGGTALANAAPDLPYYFLDCGKIDFMELVFHRQLCNEELSTIDIEVLSFEV